MKTDTMFLADGSEIVPVHFLTTPEFGKPAIACMPGLFDFTAGKHRAVPVLRTDEPRSVTCPMCKRTKFFENAKAASVAARHEWRK